MQYNNNDITDQKQFNTVANQLRMEINRRQRQQDLQHLRIANSMSASGGRLIGNTVNVVPGMINVTQPTSMSTLTLPTAYQQQQYFPTAPPNPVLHNPVNQMGGSGRSSMALALPSP